mmetsp:Transcript_13098/g.27053  ORF Transcript_13098/g.27053 Transcript_13098/m.27053 type:complete len:234 (+) Transcript_13098:454-1155(+)
MRPTVHVPSHPQNIIRDPLAMTTFNPQELFLRGREDLCPAMNRQKIKGTGHKGANNPEQEPDLYSMPPLGPSRMTSVGSISRAISSASPSLNISPPVVTPTCSGRNSEVISQSKADHLLESMLGKGDASDASALSFPQLVDTMSSAKEKVGDSDAIGPQELFAISSDELEDKFFLPSTPSRRQVEDGVAASNSAVDTGSRASTLGLPDDYDEIFNSDEEEMLINDGSFHEFIW